MKEKLKAFANNLIGQLKPLLVTFDEKLSTLIPNPKIKKIVYIGVGSLFGTMFLIITLGLLLSPLRNTEKVEETKLNKPNVVVTSPKPQKEMTDNQEAILKLETEIKEMKFPQSILNIPVLEENLEI